MLSPRYLQRLKLRPSDLEALSSPLERLQAICVAHLTHIPFENLSQHGVGEPVSLDVDVMANKLLDRKRGGFCFELNGLLAELLLEMNYKVTRVIAHVYKDGDGGGYLQDANHMFLVVTLPPTLPGMVHSSSTKTIWNCIDGDDDGTTTGRYLVDVGFAEPAIHPLRYEFNTPQTTPEGMTSRFVKANAAEDNAVVLEWFNTSTCEFVPRFKFIHSDAMLLGPNGPPLQDFYENLMSVYQPESHFARKFIVCRVTPSRKTTVAGNRMKITGPPRFAADVRQGHVATGGATPIPVVVKDLGNVDNVRAVLDSDFGIPLDQTKGLVLSKALASPPEMWMY